MRARAGLRTKKSVVKCWIYNGDNGPEVYELDERGQLKDQENGRRTRPRNGPRPTLTFMNGKIQTLPDLPSPTLSPIQKIVTSQSHTESNQTESVDFPVVSDWFSESTLDLSSAIVEWESEVPPFFFDSDPDFGFY
jgi:hypothetical protein